jgi:hypothetical protein
MGGLAMITAVAIMMSVVLMPSVRASRGLVVVSRAVVGASSFMLAGVTFVAGVLRCRCAFRAMLLHRIVFAVVVMLGVVRNLAFFAFFLHASSLIAR